MTLAQNKITVFDLQFWQLCLDFGKDGVKLFHVPIPREALLRGYEVRLCIKGDITNQVFAIFL